MGSGVCGTILARDLLGLKTEVVGVVASNAAAMARSLEAGKVVATDTANTIADGMACPRADGRNRWKIVRKGAARLVEVSDGEIAEAMRVLYRHTHNVAEGAGAAAFAALMQERETPGRTQGWSDPDRRQRRCRSIPKSTGSRYDQGPVLNEGSALQLSIAELSRARISRAAQTRLLSVSGL